MIDPEAMRVYLRDADGNRLEVLLRTLREPLQVLRSAALQARERILFAAIQDDENTPE